MWAQPWAWLGLAGLAVPIAIHLLNRHQAVRAAFPTLRFINASELNAIKRQRLTDIPLLLVRLLVIALAVAAIAGPRFGSVAVAADEEPARVTVYDMSESAATGRTDLVVEGPRPRRADVRTESLPSGLDAAIAWAIRQPGQREITIVSDFQRGSIDARHISKVPAGVGLKLERVRSTPRPLPAGFTIESDRQRMAWPAQPDPSQAILDIAVSAGPDQPRADAMLAAVAGVVPIGATRHPAVLIVFPKAPDRERLISSISPIDESWMFDVTRALMSNSPAKARVGSQLPGSTGTRLVVVLDADPGSLDAAEAVASIAAGLNEIDTVAESDPRTIPDDQLKQWERVAAAAELRREGEPQGRWLWMAVLGVLALETVMRRRAA